MESNAGIGDDLVHSSVIDEVTGAYLVCVGQELRLCVMGECFDPDDRLPDAVRGDNPGHRSARIFVATHLTRKFGSDKRMWPLNARFFVLS